MKILVVEKLYKESVLFYEHMSFLWSLRGGIRQSEGLKEILGLFPSMLIFLKPAWEINQYGKIYCNDTPEFTFRGMVGPSADMANARLPLLEEDKREMLFLF